MIPEERDTSDVNNQHPPGYHNANTHPDLNICIPRLPRGGSPCLSLEQLFDADAFSLATSSTFGNHSDPTYANADVAKDLFGGDGPRRSRLDGWAPSHHALSTRLVLFKSA